jgi:hypothetical protein
MALVKKCLRFNRRFPVTDVIEATLSLSGPSGKKIVARLALQAADAGSD